MRTEAGASVLPGPRTPQQAARAFLSSLKKPSRLLVAISGGSDSTGVLIALKEALDADKLPHSLCAVTVDHGLRPASADEALAVQALCRAHSIPHEILRWTGEKPKTGLSAAARDARYRLLAETATRFGADAVVTGHTLDDQVETIAMRSARSSEGSLGLSGMAAATLYARRQWILRPFLQTRRAAIRSYLDARNQNWIDDPSNEDLRSERARIRTRHLEPDLVAILSAAEERRHLSKRAAAWLAERADCAVEQVIRLRLDGTTSHPEPAVGHALSTLSAVLGGRPHRPSTQSLHRLLTQLANGSDFALTLSGCLVVRRKSDLFLTRERRGLLPLPLPSGRTIVWDGRYEITNHGPADAVVVPGATSAISLELPYPIRSAISGNSPEIRTLPDADGRAPPRVTLTTRLSLFDPYLSDFDLPLADEIARLFGREPAIACPV